LAGLEIESLEELLRALGHERSLRARLRVLGHSWQLLRQLSPAEREKVALRLGSSWAWSRLEKSFLRDGELDETEELVGRVFERLGDSDPAELRKLASMIRSGDRAGSQDLLLLTLQEALEEEALAVETAPQPDPWPFPGQDLAAPDLAAGPTRTAPVRQPAREQKAKPAEPEPRPPEPVAQAAREIEPDPQPLEPVPQALEPDPRALEPTGRSGPERVASVSGALASSLARPVESAATQPAVSWLEPASVDVHEDEPSDGSSIHPSSALDGVDRLRSLRSLHADPRVGADLGRQGRARLVESLGGGWASRRALSHMIASGGMNDLNEVLLLIAGLARPGHRTWCLADLIERGGLDATALERVLAAAPSDGARRRLARRADVAPPLAPR
jgi:hypothetical protein